MNYAADVRALARKDLLLELRARDTLPAMLLFVVAIFVVFHFVAPRALVGARRERAALGRDRLHRAARPRPRLRARARAAHVRRARARPCDRSAIWLAKSLATFAFLALAELVALPVFALFFHGIDGTTVARVPPRRHRHLRGRDARRRDGRRHPGARPAAPAPLPAARDPDPDRRRRRLASSTRPAGISLFLALYDALFAVALLGLVRVRRHRVRPAGGTMAEVGRSYRISLPALAAASLVLVTTALVLVFFVAPTDADQGFSQRIFYFHVSIAFTAYLCFGLGAWKALVHLWKRDPNADLESYVGDPPGRDLRLARPDHRLDLGADLVGPLVALEREPARALPRALPLLLRRTSCFASRSTPGPQRANLCAVYALFGVVLIPVSFLAIRLAQHFIHPVVFTRHGAAVRRLDPRRRISSRRPR